MSPGERVDEIIKLIDETLAEAAPMTPADDVPTEGTPSLERPPGTFGVFYLRPTG